MKKISILSALFLMFLVFVGCASMPDNSKPHKKTNWEIFIETINNNPDLYGYNGSSNWEIEPLSDEEKNQLKDNFWNDDYWSLENAKTQKPTRDFIDIGNYTSTDRDIFKSKFYSYSLFYGFMKEKYFEVLNKEEITGEDWFIMTQIEQAMEGLKKWNYSIVGTPEDWKREFLSDKEIIHNERIIKIINKTDAEQDFCSVTTYPRRWFHFEVPAHQEKAFTIEDTELNAYFSIDQIVYYFYFGGDIGQDFYDEDYYNTDITFMRYLFNEYVFEFTYDEKDFHKNDAFRHGYFTYNFKYIKKSGNENKGTILKPMTDKETEYYWGKYVNGNKNGK